MFLAFLELEGNNYNHMVPEPGLALLLLKGKVELLTTCWMTSTTIGKGLKL